MRMFRQASKSFKKVTHVIFDMDGLLLDTERIYKRVIADIARSHGKVYTPEVMAKLVGTPEAESSRIAVEEMKLPMSPKEFQKKFHDTTHKRFRENVPLMPGAEDLIKHLHQNQVPIAVATSSTEPSFLLKSQNHKDFFGMFHHIVTGGSDPEVKNGKPHPDIFLVCASRFSEKPRSDRCLVFEDSPNGVQAAIRAGMQVVMVPDKQTSPELCKSATMTISSLSDFNPKLFGLPAKR